jgi:electron transfer flavoprotein alpha subunit
MKILVIAQHKGGKVAALTYEAIGAARKIGGDLLTAVLAENAEEMAQEVATRGGGKVLAISNPALKFFNDEIYASVVGELIAKYHPEVVMGVASFYGKALFSRLAGMTGGAMIPDITGLQAEGDQITVIRPSFGGKVIATVVSQKTDAPQFITVRAKIFPESTEGEGEVVSESLDDSKFRSRSSVTDVKVDSAGSQNLAEADVVVSAGRGIKGPENADLVRKLADAMGAAFGASRAIVDAGWVPYSHQVGQTGKTVNPKLYVAVGISGAIQHLVGMQTSKTIVAINKDKDAPIFNVASYGIVGDLFDIVPAMTEKFKKELQG